MNNPTERKPKKTTLYRILIQVEVNDDGSGGEVGIGIDPPGTLPKMVPIPWMLACGHLLNMVALELEDYDKTIMAILEEAKLCKVRMSGGKHIQ